MRFKKHFTFCAYAPFDRTGTDVLGSRDELRKAIDAFAVYDNGAKSGSNPLSQAWANMNFSQGQRVFNAPIPAIIDVERLNYLEVEVYKQDDAVMSSPLWVWYYFIDAVTPTDDGGIYGENDAIFSFSLTFDVWNSCVVNDGARLSGGEITASGLYLRHFFTNAYAKGSPVNLPFASGGEIPKFYGAGEAGLTRRVSAFYSLDNTSEIKYRIVVGALGKDLKKVVFATSKAVGTYQNLIKTAQKIATAKHMKGTTGEELKEGEFTIQALYLVPDALLYDPELLPVLPSWSFGYSSSDENPIVCVENYSEERTYTANVYEEFSAAFPNDDRLTKNAPFPPACRVTVGTAFNRVDVTHKVLKRTLDGTENDGVDIMLRVVLAPSTFSIFMYVDGTPRDITNDFSLYVLTDPENDFIKNNKTNAILSGVGAVGTIVGGVASLATGAGAGVGIGMIAGGATSLVGTIDRWQIGTSTPDVIKSQGFVDVSAVLGCVYFEVSPHVDSWARQLKTKGLRVAIPNTQGSFFLVNQDVDEDDRVKCYPLAVDGVKVVGCSYNDAEEIAGMLRRGVRIWTEATSFENRHIT